MHRGCRSPMEWDVDEDRYDDIAVLMADALLVPKTSGDAICNGGGNLSAIWTAGKPNQYRNLCFFKSAWMRTTNRQSSRVSMVHGSVEDDHMRLAAALSE